MAYTQAQITKIEQSLRKKGVDEAEISKIIGLMKPKAEKPQPEPLTAEEQAILRQRKEDDAKAPEYKMRLVSAYHRRANSAGRNNPMSRLGEIEEIKNDPNVRGLARFC
jgi:hypothetical protein